jgi:hypothetical protein
MTALIRWLVLGAACNQITTIVTESLLFRPFRERVAQRSSYLGELVSCHLCFGTWVGFALAFLSPPRLIFGLPVLSTLTESFAVSFLGRTFNEITGLLKREVQRTEEETRVLGEALPSDPAVEVPNA